MWLKDEFGRVDIVNTLMIVSDLDQLLLGLGEFGMIADMNLV